MTPHLASLGNRGLRQLRNGLLQPGKVVIHRLYYRTNTEKYADQIWSMFGFEERDRQKGVFIRRRVARGKPLEAKKWTRGYEPGSLQWAVILLKIVRVKSWDSSRFPVRMEFARMLTEFRLTRTNRNRSFRYKWILFDTSHFDTNSSSEIIQNFWPLQIAQLLKRKKHLGWTFVVL